MNGTPDFAVLVNGEPLDCISTRDRGLHYGDGVFETLAVHDGQPHFWARHLHRLAAGCTRLGLPVPDADRLYTESRRLLQDRDAAVLKIIVTRGSGGRGYRCGGTGEATRILQRHPWPDYPPDCARNGVQVRWCTLRLGSSPPLAGIKHLNRLEQVLARREWDDPGIPEGLLLDGEGHPVEGTMSNLFAVRNTTLLTPDLSQCGVAGIMRSVVMELARGLGLEVSVRPLSRADIRQADELFLTNSLIGIWPVAGLEQRTWSAWPVTLRLQECLTKLDSEGTAWAPC